MNTNKIDAISFFKFMLILYERYKTLIKYAYFFYFRKKFPSAPPSIFFFIYRKCEMTMFTWCWLLSLLRQMK